MTQHPDLSIDALTRWTQLTVLGAVVTDADPLSAGAACLSEALTRTDAGGWSHRQRVRLLRALTDELVALLDVGAFADTPAAPQHTASHPAVLRLAPCRPNRPGRPPRTSA